MNLNKLKIGMRLGIGFGAVLLLAALIFAISYTRFGTILGDMERTQEYGRRASVMASWAAKTSSGRARPRNARGCGRHGTRPISPACS